MLIILNRLEGKMEHTFNTNFLYLTAKHMYKVIFVFVLCKNNNCNTMIVR